jgi:hypothetical protein
MRNYLIALIIGLLIFSIIFVSVENARVIYINNYIVSSWNEREDYLLSICKIDYNSFLFEQRAEYLRKSCELLDMNCYVKPIIDFNKFVVIDAETIEECFNGPYSKEYQMECVKRKVVK